MGGSTSITIRNADGIFTYLPQEDMAMRLPELNASQRPVQGAADYPQYLQERNARLVRSESWHGMPCDVYEFTDPELKGTTTAWVWKEKQFPVRMELNGPDSMMTVELSNVQVGIATQDAMFQLPPDVNVLDMASMMGGLQNAVGARTNEP
jgi:outer membrane lipoprotein-sorting protein